jgi:hypothetical protein
MPAKSKSVVKVAVDSEDALALVRRAALDTPTFQVSISRNTSSSFRRFVLRRAKYLR